MCVWWGREVDGRPLGYLTTIWLRLPGKAQKPYPTLLAESVGIADRKRSISLEIKIGCPGLGAVSLTRFHSLTTLLISCFLSWVHSSCKRRKVGLGGGVSLAYFLNWGKIQREDSNLYCEHLGLLASHLGQWTLCSVEMRAGLLHCLHWALRGVPALRKWNNFVFSTWS